MSTKVSLLWGDDYHLYFDYKDFQLHLELNGEEVPLPKKLREELYEIISVYESLTALVARAFAHAVKRGEVNAWLNHLSLSEVADRLIKKREEEGEEDDEYSPDELKELEERVIRLDLGLDYTYTLDEVMSHFDKGFSNFIEFPELGYHVVFAIDTDDGKDVFIVHNDSGEKVYETKSIIDLINFLHSKGAGIAHLRKFLDSYADYYFALHKDEVRD